MPYFCLLYPGQTCGSVSFPTLPDLPGHVLGRPCPWIVNHSGHSSLSKLSIQNEGRKTRTPKPLKAPTLQMDFGFWILSLFLGPCLLGCVLTCTHIFPFDQTCLLDVTMTYFHLILCQRKRTQPRPLHGNRMTHKESHSQRQNIEMLYLGYYWGPVGTREQRQCVHCVACSKEPEFW